MTIDELREITQSDKRATSRPWFYWSLQRGVSIYVTRALMYTSITPTTVTVIGLIASIVGVAFVGMHNMFIGLALIYLGILLDKVDGELARYNKQFSLRGIYLDYVDHLVIPPLFFIALGIATNTLMPYGILAAFASILIRAGWGIPAQIFAKKYSKQPEQYKASDINISTYRHVDNSIIRYFTRAFHQFQDFLVTLIVVLVALLFGHVHWIIIAYSIYLPIIFIENTIKGIYGINKTIQKFHTRAQN